MTNIYRYFFIWYFLSIWRTAALKLSLLNLLQSVYIVKIKNHVKHDWIIIRINCLKWNNYFQMIYLYTLYVFNIPHHFRIGDKYQITRLTNLFTALISHPLADPGGAHPAPPPNGRGTMIRYAQNAIRLIFFFPRDYVKA